MAKKKEIKKSPKKKEVATTDEDIQVDGFRGNIKITEE